MTDWAEGDRCRVVEHDDGTRQPKPGGKVLPGVMERMGAVYVRVRLGELYAETCYRESGWQSGDGRHQWRLMPAGDEAATAAEQE